MYEGADALEAEEQIRPYIRETPLEWSSYLSEATGAHVFLKLENLQHTGSFKVRGALNRLLSLSREERERGIVAASTGNHGMAVSYGLRLLGLSGIVFVPSNASPTKVEAIGQLGAQVQYYGLDCALTEQYARRYADDHGMTYISPYNDPYVVAGQGTIAVELLRQQREIDAVFVALGSGGMTAGIADYLKSVSPSTKIIACSPHNSSVMAESVKAGHILEMETLPTFSDGTAGGIEQGSITFELCRRLIDHYISVSEEEIAAAMRLFIERHHMLIEGAAGVAVAGYLALQEMYKGRNVVVIICGANISLDVLHTALYGECHAHPL